MSIKRCKIIAAWFVMFGCCLVVAVGLIGIALALVYVVERWGDLAADGVMIFLFCAGIATHFASEVAKGKV